MNDQMAQVKTSVISWSFVGMSPWQRMAFFTVLN